MLVLDSPPSLSNAFADYRGRHGLTMEEPDTGGSSAADDRVQKPHRIGKAGPIVMLAGVGTSAVSAVVIHFQINAHDGGLPLVSTGFFLAGGAAVVVGEVMLLAGGIGAAELLGRPATWGGVGAGLVTGGLVSGVLALQLESTELALVGAGLGLGGIACGAIQLAQVGSAARDAGVISLLITPARNGVRLAGVF